MRCFLVEQDDDLAIRQSVTDQPVELLPEGDLLVQVSWSSLNYKDALAATGHPGVVRDFPHVPGIDAVGKVLESQDPSLPTGSQVVVTGHDMGSSRWGGWSELIRVPASWAVPLPESLSARESMELGTAGFTAAQCIQALELNDVLPASGPIAVTGASGGVGSLAIRMLAGLGYEVIAVSRKLEMTEQLQAWGASECWTPEKMIDKPDRALLKADLAGAIDTVGGELLVAMLRRCQQRGCVAACGMAASDKLEMTVFPFILRGVRLAGIDSAMAPADIRQQIWQRLAGELKPTKLDEGVQVLELEQLEQTVGQMLAGKTSGRTIVQLDSRA
ncbi:MAG: YhdH/YhfP family quinone oxidoreductase [Pirellulaceae bacterium]